MRHLILAFLCVGAVFAAAPDSRVKYLGELPMDIYTPKQQTGRLAPIAIFIHGGGWVAGGRQDYGSMPEDYAKAGFLALNIDYHLAPDHRWPTQQFEIMHAIWWARRQAKEYGADPDKVILIGHSAGAHLAMMSGLTDTKSRDGYSSRANAVIAISGLYDLTKDASFRDDVRQLVRALLGDLDPSAASVDSKRYARDPIPVLMIHGALDDVVPVENAVDTADALKAVAADSVTLLVIEGEKHDFKRAASRAQIHEAVTEFLKHHEFL